MYGICFMHGTRHWLRNRLTTNSCLNNLTPYIPTHIPFETSPIGFGILLQFLSPMVNFCVLKITYQMHPVRVKALYLFLLWRKGKSKKVGRVVAPLCLLPWEIAQQFPTVGTIFKMCYPLVCTGSLFALFNSLIVLYYFLNN